MNLTFHRLFSQTLYKNLKLPLSEMSFTKDFITDTRGDLYPILHKDEACLEKIELNTYKVIQGSVERMFCGFFPYATYELTATLSNGSWGFGFYLPNARAQICYDGQTLTFSAGEMEEKIACKCSSPQETLLVTCRPGHFDVYVLRNQQPRYLCTFSCEAFRDSNLEANFHRGYVSVIATGYAVIHSASSYIDCGISQADIRPIRYENGDIMIENGKIYLSLSIRTQENMFQGIFSWVPGTSKFELTGALFYDSGDGKWCGDVAASILFNRKTSQWYLWVCSFSHGHILGHSKFKGDPRFGVNVVDITLMSKAESQNITEFAGFEGDEDPDFYYNETENKWYMAICRLDPAVRGYRYLFFRSDEPFDGYEYIGQGNDGAETGGSFVTVDGEKIFACGNDFNKRANYRIYAKTGMTEAKFDFDDGGFRGWGTIIPVELGSRKRYFWLTFDRHKGSDYNWSYGNIYCFEAAL